MLRLSAKEGKRRKAKSCILAKYCLSFFFLSPRDCYWRNRISWWWWEQCITSQGSSRSRQLFLKAALPIESILVASWSATGASHPPKGPITHSWRHLHQCGATKKVLHQSNSFPPTTICTICTTINTQNLEVKDKYFFSQAMVEDEEPELNGYMGWKQR